MGMEKCVTSFNEATGLNLTEEESSSILRAMLKAKQRIVDQRGIASADAMQQAATSFADKKAQAARENKIRVLRDANKRELVVNQVIKNGGLKNAMETLHAMLRGSNKIKDGGRDSIENNWHSWRNQWSSVLSNTLYKAGLKKVAESGELDKEISVAMFKLSNGEEAGHGPAVEIAKINAKTLDAIRDRINAVGGKIGDAKNYVTTTEWDSVKMRQAAGSGMTPDEAFESWWAKDAPRMADKTFDSVVPEPGQSIADARKTFGRSIFDGFLTGIHMKVGEPESGYVHPDYEGTSNVGNKVAAHRAIIWKDGEAWHGHMQDFGKSPTMNAAINNSIERGSRALSLMGKLGDNPGAQLNMIVRRIQEKYRGDVDGIAKFNDGINRLTNEMKNLDGTLNIPANMGLEKFTAGVMQVEAMSSLGGVGITHFASIWPSVTAEGVHHGVGRLEMLGNIVKSLGTSITTEGRSDVLSDMGAFGDGNMRHVYGKIGDDSIPGRLSAWTAKFMDFTGIHILFDRTKSGVQDMLAHNLGRNATNDWDKLDPHLSDMLERYRIGKDEWSLLQTVKEMPKWRDRNYLTPSSAAEGMDKDAVQNYLRSKGIISEGADEASVNGAEGKFRQDVSDKLLSYYTDAAKHSVVSPGVRERALLLQGTQKGTGANTMLRFLTQFKMWPVAAYNQILEREIYTSLSKKEAAWNIGSLVALGVPAGYLRMTISDLTSGRPPRDPSKPETLLAAAAQSGGLGIMGDFLFGETSRMGGGLVPTLGGPVVSDMDTLIHIFNRAKQDTEDGGHHKNGTYGDIWPDLAHFGVRHVPFANLVYLKGALDYMLWYHLYEAASPGWWERTNRRLAKEQGRVMTGYQPGGGVPQGVPGVYLKNNQGSSGLFGDGQQRTSQ